MYSGITVPLPRFVSDYRQIGYRDPYLLTMRGVILVLRIWGFLLPTYLLGALTQQVYAGGNFAFTAQAEPGLRLEVTGFGEGGKQLFDLPSDEERGNNGTSNYVVHVDEQIIFAERPIRWCLTLVGGQSSKLLASTPLCDDNPQESRGTYVFEFQATATTASALAAPGEQIDGGIRYEVGAGVAQAALAIVKSGLSVAEKYASGQLGGVDPKLRQELTVTVVATGKGNDEPGGNNAPATSFYHNEPGPFFDVMNQQWTGITGVGSWSAENQRTQIVAHEYGHLWMYSLGAYAHGFQVMERWMNEGIASYIGYSALVADGRLTLPQARSLALQSARNGQLVDSLDAEPSSLWPGDVGFLAVDWLVSESPVGALSLRTFGQELGRSGQLAESFQDAFGIGLNDFYRQFESWRQIAVTDPDHALERRPVLVRGSSPLANAPPQTAEQLFALAYAYSTGTGEPKDDARAAAYYQQAVDAGSVPAMRNLAGIYGSGRGVTADQAKAKELFLAAAQRGDAQAQYALANWYTTDRQEKIAWLQKAAAQNHADAIALLKQLGASAEGSSPPVDRSLSASSVTSSIPAGKPVGSSRWQWNKTSDGLCVVQGNPVETDAKMPRHAQPYLFVVNAVSGNPNHFGISMGTSPPFAQFYVLIDGYAYPMRDTGKVLIPAARSVSSTGAIQGFSFSSLRLAGRTMIAAMRAGTSLVLETQIRSGPHAGTVYRDVYSLDGFGPVKDGADQECQGLSETQMAKGIGDDVPVNKVPVSKPASTAIECVQQEFAAMKLMTGEPTGRLDKTTLAASKMANAQFQAAGSSFPQLTEKNAKQWCLATADLLVPSFASIAEPIADATTIRFGLDASRTNMPTIYFMAGGSPLLSLAPKDLDDELVGGKTLHLATVAYDKIRYMDSICFEAPTGFDIVDKDGTRHGSTYCSGKIGASYLATEVRDWFTLTVARDQNP